MAVPYTFGTATASIPLSQLDSNFATVITLGNTAIQLGNTVTTLNNMTLANVTISSGNITLTNVSATTANVTTANVVTMIITGNETVQGNTTVTGTITGAKLIPTGSSATGNGMYLPATNSVGISTNGTNAVYIDASQNVGIGTSSPGAKLDIGGTNNSVFFKNSGATTGYALATISNTGGVFQYGVSSSTGTFWGSGNAGNYSVNIGTTSAVNLGFGTSDTLRMVLDSSGNVGIGTSSPSYKLDVVGTGDLSNRVSTTGTSNAASIILQSGSGTTSGLFAYARFLNNDTNAQDWRIGTYGTNNLSIVNAKAGTVPVTVDTSGNLLVGLTTAAGSERLSVTGNVANNIARFVNSNASPYGPLIQYPTGVDPNGTSNEFIDCRGNATIVRFQVRSNGGVANYSANNVNLSDERTKTDIQDAGGYLSKICAIPVRTFKYKDQTDDLLNLGVIAQEVEAVAPELIDVSGFGETPEDGIPLKAIYQTDFQYALMKCIQEQQALITSLTARIEALEAK